MKKFPENLRQKLLKRQEENALRRLYTHSPTYDFCSNDYLGLAQNAALRQQIEQATQEQNYKIGATGSRLISGNTQYAQDLENYLAQIFDAPAALLFNSGYQANTAVLSAIPQRHDLVIADQLIHASLKEGIRLSFADKTYFGHNDLKDLEKKLQSQKTCYVVVESVYSMEGDQAPLAQIVEICEKYGAYLIVDEAHSTGLFGKNGSGLLCEKGLQDRVFARIYTFGKAIGTHGACVVGDSMLIDYLINFGNSFIYTTALPFHSLLSIRKAFEFLEKEQLLARRLFEKIAFFQENAQKIGLNFPKNDTPIQILPVGGNEKTKALAQNLQDFGFDVRAILSPTVREGKEILRICLHTYNAEQEIEQLLLKISEMLKK